MEKPVKGDVVVVPFPFSDLSNAKRRPALITASLNGDDVILCQITSQPRADGYSVAVSQSDFEHGGLPVSSVIRPSRLFTAAREIVLYKAGALKHEKVREVEKQLVALFTS